MLKQYFSYLALGAIFVGLLGSLGVPQEAGAASHRVRNYSGSNSRRQNSELNNKIRDLGDEPVAELRVPILLGVAPAQVSDTWGEARAVGRTHEGTDIFAPRGAFVVSPTDAVVTSAVVDSKTNTLGGTYVYTTNPGGERYYYAHLDSIARGIEPGKVLKQGDLIGYVGNTGNAAGGATHLHFGIYKSGATNPYPRLTMQFSDEERMDALTKILDDADSADVLARTIVSQYRSYFLAVKAKGLKLPTAIATALGSSAVTTVVSNTSTGATVMASGPRSITLGVQGSDVIQLQQFLITQNKGPAAAALAAAGATGYFGAISQSALAEFQASVGISPAAGYFGPLTRTYLQTNNLLTI